MKVFDHSFRASDAEMHKMLDKADLTGHGYKKEVTTKLVRNGDSGKTDYQASNYVCVFKHMVIKERLSFLHQTNTCIFRRQFTVQSISSV